MTPIAKRLAPLLLLLPLCACIAGSGESQHAAQGGGLALFLLGVWHGLIGPFTLIGEVINWLAPHVLPWPVHFYEPKASGAPYDLGFFFGLAGGPSLLWNRWSSRA